jgi:uncharacterized protein YjdB
MSLFLSIPGFKKARPAAPEVILPTTQSITVISSSGLLYIGISETFTAMATMSDGTSKAVIGGVWGGDNPSVATVQAATGRVTIVGSGTDFDVKFWKEMIKSKIAPYEGQSGNVLMAQGDGFVFDKATISTGALLSGVSDEGYYI